jgi:Fe(II)/alpha-ketoglutarate-dependent arginine beta-hydroxylase
MSTRMNAPVATVTATGNNFDLTASEIREFRAILAAAIAKCRNFDDKEFLKTLPIYAHRLPERLRRFLIEFKYNPGPQGYCIVSNFPVDDSKLGATPGHWHLESNNDTCLEAVMAACMYAAMLGDIFGWLTQQDGRMVHDVMPIRQFEHEQLGAGSREELTWHTEDAFHELRGDYLLLFCLRNPDGVPTTISRPDYRKLRPEYIELLSGPHFTIRPDNSHKPEFGSELGRAAALKRTETGRAGYLEHAYATMMSRDRQPQKVAVLFGSKSDPYLRIDPYFMGEPDDPEARNALRALIDLIEESLIEVALRPGQCVMLDNYSVVHGRRAFSARYDGTDRWLKRIAVMRDIRKCRHVLEIPDSRVIF